ncbi:helix-turn-helix transcriptional regulator [Haloferula sp. BvORR071]|uniref:helix-turn-helix domain-containing protein n=1 Tax=Haloferula sp. BvORR071 TaxID=1396141 RepID=UPI00054E9287|nr:helix-turn-helix transcriptional regulator [Haloferula sp. BvORR071]
MARSYPLNVVGRQVAKLRTAGGMSQAELAAACQLLGWDIARDTIAKIEGGLRWVGDIELIHLARALKTDVASLFPEEPLYRDCFRSKK